MKNKCKTVWCFIILSFALSCGNKEPGLTVNIENVLITNAVSSGSGLASINDSIFIVGDDAEFIGKLSISDSQYTRIALYPNATMDRIPRSIKHDLESCTLGTIGTENFLFAFGSGTLSPYRDTLFALNIKNADSGFKRSLLPLYTAIKAKAGLNEKELNIEGAALVGDKLLLFNRGKNLIIVFQWQHFAEYILLQNSSNLPPFNIISISLPVINNFQVGFSGACAVNEHELLFTASLEETTDFTLDGTIKGSYIGMLKFIDDTHIKLIAFSTFKSESGSISLDKLESIEVVKTKGKNIKSIAVADNDNGTSKIFYLNIVAP